MLKSETGNCSAPGTVSRRAYALLLSFTIMAGIVFCAAVTTVSHDWDIRSWNHWAAVGFFVGMVLLMLAGRWIADAFDSPLASGCGFVLVVVPVGLVLGLATSRFTDVSVLRVLVLTIMMTLILGIIGAATPKDLSGWGNYLFGGLALLLLGLLTVPIMSMLGFPVEGAMTLLDWVGLVLFGALVIYDMNRAMRLPHTVDNAIDSALAVFLDMANIFSRLLGLLGAVKSD